VIKNKSSFNKKKWLKNYFTEITRLKSDGLTYQAIIQSLKEQQQMPFDLDESLLSRYLKEFSNNESATLQTKTALNNKIERQKDRLTRQNNEIQNLKRQSDRTFERDMRLKVENAELKERNRVLENKFLDGEARINQLRRYNGFNNISWKITDLESKNDEFLAQAIRLERLLEDLDKSCHLLQQEIAEHNQQAMLLTQQVTDLNNQNESTKNQLKQALSEKESLIQDISALNQQIQNSQEAEQASQSRYRNLKEKFDEAYRILEEQHQTILKYESDSKRGRFWKW